MLAAVVFCLAMGAWQGLLQWREPAIGLDAKKAFGGLLKARERAKLEFAKEKAKDKFSKLANAIGRPPTKFQTGQLVMVWRQSETWKDQRILDWPLRVVLVDGQVRPVT